MNKSTGAKSENGAVAESYEAAVSELEEILENLQDGEVNVDELAQKVDRSSELIKFCQEKITSAEMQVKKIVGELDASSSGDSE